MDNTHQSTLPLASEYEVLTFIGLSPLNTYCYQIIYQQDFITVPQIAQLLNKPYRSIYRVIKDLQSRGFIKHVYTGQHPHRYTAVLLQDAIIIYGQWQQAQIEPLLKTQQRRYCEKTLQELKP